MLNMASVCAPQDPLYNFTATESHLITLRDTGKWREWRGEGSERADVDINFFWLLYAVFKREIKMNLCDLTETFNNLHAGKCVWMLELLPFPPPFSARGWKKERESKVKFRNFSLSLLFLYFSRRLIRRRKEFFPRMELFLCERAQKHDKETYGERERDGKKKKSQNT